MAQTKKAGRADRAKTGMIRARIDPDLKARAEAVLGDLGLKASDAIRLFYTQITLSDGLPFDVRIPNAETRKAIRDARAGKGLNHYSSAAEMFKKMGL
ncbi:MAG TPA: type II toxin-antitoxin system RelB/DinJ family antitoxin [Isosphaeraceae bacterium]|nr:type II toxin-antitoxin system RelB/DinJ family antitoxin [Isosphaeraceae bacterium]